MRKIKFTNRFKRDYKREKSGRHRKKLDAILMETINMLAADALLPRPTSITHSRASGAISAIATSGLISF